MNPTATNEHMPFKGHRSVAQVDAGFRSPIYQYWTADEDYALLDLIGDGASFGEAAKQLRRTRGSCISRFRRITGVA